jgi:hypothetical protein
LAQAQSRSTFRPRQPRTRPSLPLRAVQTTIAHLTDKERKKCMAEGRCLRCRERGHLARDCTKYEDRPNPGGPPTYAPRSSNPPRFIDKKKFTPKEATTRVRQIMATFKDGEYKEFRQLMDNAPVPKYEENVSESPVLPSF